MRPSEIIRCLARCDLSEGATKTFLEFLWHFLAKQGKLPSYSELAALRRIARSTVQEHIEELERFGLLKSIRLPGNRKKYSVDYTRLLRYGEDKPVATESVVTPKEKSLLRKHKNKYSTSELVSLFKFQYQEIAGEKYKDDAVHEHYNQMRLMHKLHGATKVAKMIEHYSEHYHSFHKPFTLDSFFKLSDKLAREIE